MTAAGRADAYGRVKRETTCWLLKCSFWNTEQERGSPFSSRSESETKRNSISPSTSMVHFFGSGVGSGTNQTVFVPPPSKVHA